MVRTGRWKLVFDPEQGGVQQFVDASKGLNNILQNVADGETVTVSKTGSGMDTRWHVGQR